MSLVVREDWSVSLPAEMAEEMGIRKGTPVRWERAEDGGLMLRAATGRAEAARRLRGMLAHTLKPGESAVADLIREREEAAILEERV